MARPTAKVLAACTFGLLTSTVSAVGVGDAAAMVQSSVHAHQQQAAQALASSDAAVGRAQLLARLASSQFPDVMALLNKPFDCDAHPLLCQEPFNCQDFHAAQHILNVTRWGVAPSGQANLQTWCLVPAYGNYLHTCLADHDLVRAGHIQYDWTVAQHMGIEEADGSYCFIEGHCSNTAVTKDTTLEESYKMCDDRYGHEAWTKFGAQDIIPLLPKLSNPAGFSLKTGFHDTSMTKVFLKAACAMGNYHCDVVYCKETYCKDPYYIQRYGHLLPKVPGHLIEQKDWLP